MHYVFVYFESRMFYTFTIICWCDYKINNYNHIFHKIIYLIYLFISFEIWIYFWVAESD